jgi:AmmeMemoRadiSam system protein B
MPIVRRAAVAGSWYPAEADPLRTEVEDYLSRVQISAPPGRIVALVGPHAGLHYSGPVAAHTYKTIEGSSGLTVLLVGPSHRMAFRGVAVVGSGGFETPLGAIPVDETLARDIIGRHVLLVDDLRPHRDEHSLEMHLPFLQHAVRDLKIVPMLMGSQVREEVDALAAALAAAARGRRDVLLVASSDLSHYHPASVANQLDARVIDDVRGFDADALMDRLERSHEHACGGGPMVAVMKAARALGADRGTVLRYADSGDVPPRDKSRVVGYLAAAFTAPS